MRAFGLLAVLLALAGGFFATKAAAKDCPPDVSASDWPWPNAGEVRRAKLRIFCYDVTSTTAYVAAPSGLVPDELFAASHQVAPGQSGGIIEFRFYSFRGRKGSFYYVYNILEQKPPPRPRTSRAEVNGSVARLAPPDTPQDRLSTGFSCDREQKWCSLLVLGDTPYFSVRFDAKKPGGNLCFLIVPSQPGEIEPKATVMVDGKPIVENGVINKWKTNHCMGDKSGDAIDKVLAANTLTIDVVRASGNMTDVTDHRTLDIQHERLALLFEVTRFAYAHTVLQHDRPDAQPALKKQADKLLKLGD